jgi:hypothetical protein
LEKLQLKNVCVSESGSVVFRERVARLVSDLEAHERFWYYLVFFELKEVYRNVVR